MKKIIFTALIWLSVFPLIASELSDGINQFITNKTADSFYEIDHEQLFSGSMLQQFYTKRNDAPAWINTHSSVWFNTSILPWDYANFPPARLINDSSARNESGSFSVMNSYVLGDNGVALLNYIRQMDQHGLHPNDYHLALIEKYMGKTGSFMPVETNDLMKLDVLLTDAFFLVGLHLY
ncbi:MAG: hypothetical protein JXR31_16400, partial [Prolixibacteraceae bacterium]|nr:hypothetical protein [Prolixibacteraceae bacterium]